MRLLPFALALALLGGCAGSSDQPSAVIDDGSAGAGGESSSVDPLPSSLKFSAVPPLRAREEVELKVQALPTGPYRVRFSLPTTSRDPKDAVLDRTEVTTDERGEASVVLTAPSEMTAFQVRATVGGSVTATLDVEMSSSVTATLQVRPVRTGRRPATTWVATVHEGVTCADVPGVPPEDGKNVGFASADQAPELQNVKIGVPLAVTLRSGHFMGGCSTLESLRAEAADTPQVVEVTVLERPIDLSASTLSLSLGVTEEASSWQTLAQATSVAVVAAIRGGGSTDSGAVLDAMGVGLADDERQLLEDARGAEGWDARVVAQWGADSRLYDTVSRWLAAGSAKLAPSDAFLLGRLAPSSSKIAYLSLDTVAGVEAEAAGFISPSRVSWSAGADDTVVISGELYFVASRLVTSLAEQEALSTAEADSDFVSTLSAALECAALGSSLAALGDDPLLAYEDCDGVCLAQLCEESLSRLWQRGQLSTATDPARLSVAASGSGRVGDGAELAGIIGTWVGKLSTSESLLSTSGTLTAAEPPLMAK